MYLKDYKDLEFSDEEISVLTMVFNSNDSGANANAKNFLHN